MYVFALSHVVFLLAVFKTRARSTADDVQTRGILQMLDENL